jgi:sRNA-binding carbon storage regulator CsrA
MLVLRRKPGQEVVIGDYVRLTVMAIPAVSIRREELCEQAEDLGTLAERPATLEVEL